MKIIRRSEFKSVPWKNRGGITHEIARQDGRQNLLWRISIAEVSQDGPFSQFVGLSRSLTVIAGTGMNLIDAAGNLAHTALPLQPITFSGDEPLQGALLDGPCQDFNLIYDARSMDARVDVLDDSRTGLISPPKGAMTGLLCIVGSIDCGAQILECHDFVFLDPNDEPLRLSPTSTALRVILKQP